MSYLTSILASISGDDNIPTSPSVSRQTPRPSGTSNGDVARDTPVRKRKAEDDLRNVVSEKERHIPSTVANRTQALKVATSPQGSLAYRGSATTDRPKTLIKPLPKSSAGLSSTNVVCKTENPQMVGNTPVASSPAARAPKKGSFQEIMARGKTIQQANPVTGTIKHKQTQKLSRKERITIQGVGKGKNIPLKNGQSIKNARSAERTLGGIRSRTGSSESGPRKVGEQQKEKRKAVDLGYKGTMRPSSSEPQYKGTMSSVRAGQARKPMGVNARRGENGSASRDRGPRYVSYSEEEEEEDDYESDASSAMEADAFEVDREEEFALRAAKKEDAKAAAEEAEHKRQKERRKMLEKMAADKAKKKPVY